MFEKASVIPPENKIFQFKEHFLDSETIYETSYMQDTLLLRQNNLIILSEFCKMKANNPNMKQG